MNRNLKKSKSLHVFSDGSFFFSTFVFSKNFKILEKDFKNSEYNSKFKSFKLYIKNNDKFKYRSKLKKNESKNYY